MSPLSEKRLEAELRLKPEPLADFHEDEDSFHVGPVSVSKKYARFSVGFSHPIVNETHFESQKFRVGDQDGCAVVLYSGGTPEDYFVGWVRADQQAEADAWVQQLNAEVERRLADAKAKGDHGPVEVLSYH